MPILPQSAVVQRVKEHLSNLLPRAHLSVRSWTKGPVEELGSDFAVIELSPTRESNNLWVYCTAGTGRTESEAHQHEFVLLSSSSEERHIETLTMLAHYHRFESPLGLGHVVTIGRSWVEGSLCDRLLMSLPYPFGPKLEWLTAPTITIQLLWALPITSEEADFLKQNGIEELERRFDSAKLQYWDSLRESVV
ncbi:MAG: suppressor of fused domain protein [Terriglobales bacterium]